MCRNIRTLFNFEPPATDEEIRAASLQFVRKLSGFTKPSRVNQDAFDRAIEEIFTVSRRLIESMVSSGEPRNRAIMAERARQRAEIRFGPRPTARHSRSKSVRRASGGNTRSS